MSSHCNKFADDPALWAALRDDQNPLSQNLAFKCLYEKYYRSIEIFVCENSGAENEARDAFQEIIVVLCKYCRNPDFKPHVKVKTFIDAIGRRWWFHRLRGRKGTEIYTDLAQIRINEDGEVETAAFVNLPDTAPETENREIFLTALDQAMARMEDKCRQILRLTYWEELRDDAIAPIIGAAVGSVKVLRHRCMERLRGYFNPEQE